MSELQNKNVFYTNIINKDIVMDEKKFLKTNMRRELDFLSKPDENESEFFNLMNYSIWNEDKINKIKYEDLSEK